MLHFLSLSVILWPVFCTFNLCFTVSIRNDVTELLNACSVFLCPQAQCKEVRKKKELVLQILTEPIRNWEGDDIRTLGPVLHMSQAAVHSQNCPVLITTCKNNTEPVVIFLKWKAYSQASFWSARKTWAYLLNLAFTQTVPCECTRNLYSLPQWTPFSSQFNSILFIQHLALL